MQINSCWGNDFHLLLKKFTVDYYSLLRTHQLGFIHQTHKQFVRLIPFVERAFNLSIWAGKWCFQALGNRSATVVVMKVNLTTCAVDCLIQWPKTSQLHNWFPRTNGLTSRWSNITQSSTLRVIMVAVRLKSYLGILSRGLRRYRLCFKSVTRISYCMFYKT